MSWKNQDGGQETGSVLRMRTRMYVCIDTMNVSDKAETLYSYPSVSQSETFSSSPSWFFSTQKTGDFLIYAYTDMKPLTLLLYINGSFIIKEYFHYSQKVFCKM